MSSDFNWSWINSSQDTLKSSNSINNSGGIIHVLQAADRGLISNADLRSTVNSVTTNINQQWNLWQNNIRPFLDSLPAGPRDTRWRYGKGLPTKIDALNFGIQGSTLFVFNDATTTKALGRYWDSDSERPITIAEAIENLWSALNNIEVSGGTSGETGDLEPLWRAVGHRYQDESKPSLSTSLDARTKVLESNIQQLTKDLYGIHQGYTQTFGIPLTYSVAQNISYLLQIHGVTGWQSDPSTVSHDDLVVSVPAHTHPYSQISPMPSIDSTQGRIAPYSTLENDILRLRYELQVVKGASSWYSDVIDPVTSTAGSLNTHINYVGSGTVSLDNPHGLNYEDIGADTLLDNIANFIGMSDYTIAETPNYTSVNYITQNTSLETAISDLDLAINNMILGFTTSVYYGPYDRSSIPESTRETTAIIITHNKGEYPASVNVIDLSPSLESIEGMYSSPLVDVITDYPDLNTVRIWTSARIISVSLIFHGPAAASLTEIGGVTLQGAYNYGGAGVGKSILANSGSVTIAVTLGGNNNVLELNQNDTSHKNNTLVIGSNTNSTNFYTDAFAINLTGTNTAGQTIWSDKQLNIGSLYDSEYRGYILFGNALNIISENISTGDCEINISSLGNGIGNGYLNLESDYLNIGSIYTKQIGFIDLNLETSSWTGNSLLFSSSSSEYNTYISNFGEESLLYSINSIYSLASGSFDYIGVNSGTYQFSGTRNSLLGVTYTDTGVVNITLMSLSAVEGRMVIIKDVSNNSSVYTITISTEGSETIDGSASTTITTNRGSLILVYDGISNWNII